MASQSHPRHEETDGETESLRAETEAAVDLEPKRSAPTSKENDHSQSLRSKLVLSLALMLAVVVGIDEIVRQKVIAPEFANLEKVAALKDTNRVLSAINTEVEFLAESAAWDAQQLSEFIRDRSDLDDAPRVTNRSFSLSHTKVEGVADRIEWTAIVDQYGNWNWLTNPALSHPHHEGTPQPNEQEVAEGEHPTDHFPSIAERIAEQVDVTAGNVRGMTRSSNGELHLFAATPIVPTSVNLKRGDGNVSPAYFYVVGRRFGDEVMAELQQRTSVTFTIDPLDEASAIRKSVDVDRFDPSNLSVIWPLLNPKGTPLAELNVQLPRDVTSRSARTTAFARYLSLCGACASLLLLLLLLQRIVIGRLETIREHTETIAQRGILSEGTSSPVLQIAGQDEIGQLAKSFDRMRTRLSDAQRRLSDASHAAGMSLVADTVIHNVGNVLTNVNSLIETATRRVDSLRIEPLEKLADRLRSEDVDEALQQATPDYLQRLSQTLEQDRDELASLLQTLNDNVQHIHQVIRDQRRHANQPVKWQQMDLQGVIREAVRCSQASLNKDNVQVRFAGGSDLQIWTDRSLLLQILINIISNAGNASREIKSRQPTLKITLVPKVTSVDIRFSDNGCGMDDQTLSRVFDAHFTTRQTGSGLGLHFCAIAMKRLGGSIRAESDGPDCGATFVVEVPLQRPDQANKTSRTRNAKDVAKEAIDPAEESDMLVAQVSTGSRGEEE